tara:strand:+ start:804 stop:1178 length:375 start_codon:yes stop_codon:yes gene_type:complete
MALGNANSSAQSRGKNKSVVVKRRKEVVAAKNTVSIIATALTGESTGAGACGSGLAFNQEYFLREFSGGVGSYLPDVGSKVYTRKRINDRFAITEGLYLFKVGGANWLLNIGSDSTVADRTVCR